jgi:hypothetical protein
MWSRKRGDYRWGKKFFRIVSIPDTLVNHYKTNFFLMHKFGWSLEEISMMLPWERDSYLGMLMDYLDKQKEQ